MFFSLNFIIISGYECRISIQMKEYRKWSKTHLCKKIHAVNRTKIRKNKNYYKRYTIRFINRWRLYLVLVNKASSAVRNAAHDLARGDKSDLRDKAVKPITNNVSVLIMGVDESDVRGKEYGEAIRTDALLLATFNKDSKTVKLLSIPRDTYTYIPIEKKKIKLHMLMHSVLLKTEKWCTTSKH